MLRSALRPLLVSTLIVTLIASAGALATPPERITYQSQLFDADGLPLAEIQTLKFAIYESAASSEVLWEENWGPLQLENGVIDLVLGSNGNPIPSSIFTGTNRFLEITVDGVILEPRQQLAAVPYSLSTHRLDDLTLGELQADVDSRIAGHSLDEAYDAGGSGAGRTINASSGAVNIAGSGGLHVNGRLGVGNTNPGYQLDVSGTARIRNAAGIVDHGLTVDADGLGDGSVGRGIALGSTTSGEGMASRRSSGTNQYGLDLITGNVPRVSITKTGLVGIRTSAPTEALHVVGSVLVDNGALNLVQGGTPGFEIRSTGSGTPYIDFTQGTEDYDARFILTGDGRLQLNVAKFGIGRTAINRRLEVEGNASKTNSGVWAANSDARIKTDVMTLSGALERLERVRLVSYRYEPWYVESHPSLEVDRRYVNVIAQEFQGVYPNAVEPAGDLLPDGDATLQVDIHPMLIDAVAGVQELHRQLREKDAQIEKLEERLRRIERVLDSQPTR